MGLFTSEEKLNAWNRFKTGRSAPMDRILAHTMIVSGNNLAELAEIGDEALYNKVNAGYRLVNRGLIRTTAQFNRIVKELLK